MKKPLKRLPTGLGRLLVAFLARVVEVARFEGLFTGVERTFAGRYARGAAYLSILNRDGLRPAAWHHDFLSGAPLDHKVLICKPNP